MNHIEWPNVGQDKQHKTPQDAYDANHGKPQGDNVTPQADTAAGAMPMHKERTPFALGPMGNAANGGTK